MKTFKFTASRLLVLSLLTMMGSLMTTRAQQTSASPGTEPGQAPLTALRSDKAEALSTTGMDSQSTATPRRASSSSIVNVTVGGLLYGLNTADSTASVAKLNDENFSGGIVIPDEINYEGTNYKVTSIDYQAFFWCQNLTSITLPAGLTSIDEMAFSHCVNLTSITFPAGLTSIGQLAFANCDKLTSIAFPAGLTSIGNGAFEECQSLSSVTFPADAVLTSIGEVVFKECPNLASVTLPAGLMSIGDAAFSDCQSLSSVTFPAWLTSIGGGAFQGCKKLSNVVLPKRLLSIGPSAFSGCESFTEITLTPYLQEVGSYAFRGCKNLKTVTLPKRFKASLGTDNEQLSGAFGVFSRCPSLVEFRVEDGNTAYKSVDGVLFSRGLSMLYCYPAGKKATSYTIPASVASLATRAFDSCMYLEKLIFPYKYSGSRTFFSNAQPFVDGCDKLTQFIFPPDFPRDDWKLYAPSNFQSITLTDTNSDILIIPEGLKPGQKLYVDPSVLEDYRDYYSDENVFPIPTTSINLTAHNYTTLYTSKESYVMPKGLVGGIVRGENNGKLDIDWRFKAGDYVPGGTALLLKGEEGKTYTRYQLPADAFSTDTTGLGQNKLIGTDEEGWSNAPYNACYYKLKKSPAGINAGFYWDNKDGAAFKVSANEAYLAFPYAGYGQIEGFPLFSSLKMGITTKEGYGTFYSDQPYVMPEGLQGAIITGAENPRSDDFRLVYDWRYLAGDLVPAKTALLLKGNEGVKNYYAEPADGYDEPTPEGNLLHGADAVDERGYTNVGGVWTRYYVLTYDQNGQNLGFYYQSEYGPIKYQAPYAFLALDPTKTQTTGFVFDSTMTGIPTVTDGQANRPTAIYTLDGRRVNATTTKDLTKGLYIINGRKVVVK